MQELELLRKRLESERPVEWGEFPDLSLYMDQVLAYMPRQLIDLGETETLTSAMVNNYIKDGLLPRADGKKYSQVHLAYLTVICALKQVISVKEAHTLIQAGEQLGWKTAGVGPEPTGEDRNRSVSLVYDYFCGELDKALLQTASALPEEAGEDELPKLALSLALRSYADQLACRRILGVIQASLPEKPDKKEEKKAKKQKKAEG